MAARLRTVRSARHRPLRAIPAFFDTRPPRPRHAAERLKALEGKASELLRREDSEYGSEYGSGGYFGASATFASASGLEDSLRGDARFDCDCSAKQLQIQRKTQNVELLQRQGRDGVEKFGHDLTDSEKKHIMEARPWIQQQGDDHLILNNKHQGAVHGARPVVHKSTSKDN